MAKNGSRKQKKLNKKSVKPSTKESKRNTSQKGKRKKTDSGKFRTISSPKGRQIQTPKANLKPSNPRTAYQKANSSKRIESIVKKEKRLRYKGRFISKEAQDSIIKFSKILDRENIDYNLETLLNVPEIQKKVLITKDEAPKEIFYWNVQNSVTKNKFGEDVELTLIDTDGEILYKGKSEKKAGAALYAFNKKVDNLRKIIELKEGKEGSGFTIPVSETRRNGETIKLTIDLRKLKPRYTEIPQSIWDQYKSML